MRKTARIATSAIIPALLVPRVPAWRTRLQSSVSAIPKFLVRGRLNKTNCSLSAPFTGEITVVSSEATIRSIELQLVRVETIGELLPCSPA